MGYDEYYRLLGHFISMFSDTEKLVVEVLRHVSGASKPVARALFSGTRTDAACSYIKRIGDAKKWPKERQEAWKNISDHLSYISLLRNHIVHYGADWRSLDQWVVTNKNIALTPDSTINLPISRHIFEAAMADLNKIDCHLLVFAWPKKFSHLAEVHEALARAWLYKPPPQGGRPQRTQNKPQARKHPPKSSRR